ncbi:MAG: hypothetical protein J7L07_02745 [Candidatus Odinarchaeota archaeon]|nr:hypothetical protein [Candidatus Odinarchaeota archaeon]
MKAVINNAKKYVEIKQKYGSFTNYIESFKNPLDLAKNLIKNFQFIGPTNVWDYLKSIGIDAIKPDIHVRRILHRLGLINSDKPSPKTDQKNVKSNRRKTKHHRRSNLVLRRRQTRNQKTICGKKHTATNVTSPNIANTTKPKDKAHAKCHTE